jgi:hypothetical protein
LAPDRLFAAIFGLSALRSPPDAIAAEIVENLEAALKQFREVALALGSEVASEAE